MHLIKLEFFDTRKWSSYVGYKDNGICFYMKRKRIFLHHAETRKQNLLDGNLPS